MNGCRERPARAAARALWFAAAVAGLAAQSCTGSGNWKFHLVPENGKARVDTDRVTLIFEGVAWDHPPGGRTGGARGTLTVSGVATAVVNVAIDGKKFRTTYRRGVNTVTLENYELRIVEGGRRLEVGGKSFDLTGRKKTIVIHEDGSASVLADGDAKGGGSGK